MYIYLMFFLKKSSLFLILSNFLTFQTYIYSAELKLYNLPSIKHANQEELSNKKLRNYLKKADII